MIFVMNDKGNSMVEVKSDMSVLDYTESRVIESMGIIIARFELNECLVDKRGDHYFLMARDEINPSEKYIEDEITEHEFKQAIKEVDEYNLYQKNLAEAVFVELIDTIQEKLTKNESGIIYIDRIIKHEKELLDLDIKELSSED